MGRCAELDVFLKSIMKINVVQMGGASAGILGVSGADGEVINNLKNTSLAFANECCKPTASSKDLDRLSNKIGGFLQTLQLINTLSNEHANELFDQLEIVMTKIRSTPYV
jgi:hypothetical protein